MNAKETKIQPFIEGTKQFVVPLFQRPYSWERKHWEILWNDLMELYDEEQPRNHFIGSVVTMPAVSVPEGVTKYVLIDGQQRLTTILILLTLIRDIARAIPGSLADQIENLLLLNPYQEGNDRFKLLPTQVDRQSFTKLVQSQSISHEDQITQAYKYFDTKIRSVDSLNFEKLRGIIVKNLVLVSIVLDADDNPHLIFESLNAKGRALTQADLIRNYFFMRMHADQQESLYVTYWAPLQKQLEGDLTECIRHFLMKDGSIVKQGEVFFTLKDRADKRTQSEVINYLEELVEFAGYYEKFLHPERESNQSIRDRFERLNRLEVTTAYPFLLNAYHDFNKKHIDESQFIEILETLESFILRRFVCGVPTNTLNKIFPTLYSQALQSGDLVCGLKTVLATKNFPRDLEFQEKFVSTRFYGGDRAIKGKLILERLEASFEHQETVNYDKLTIEHVMPQTLTDDWKKHLGPDWENIHATSLHTIGNLSLSGYNPQLSNANFETKRDILKESHLELNKYFHTLDAWNENFIYQRAKELALRASLVWKYFGTAQVEIEELIESEIEPEVTTGGFNLANVLSLLGGGTSLPNEAKLSVFQLTDKNVVIFKYSKLYVKNNCYWFGLRPKLFEDFQEYGVTHVAFVLGQIGVATIPVEILRLYKYETKASFLNDGSIRHYHVLISNEYIPHLYWSSETPRRSLNDHFRRFDTKSV
jgi:uncharacterized protein with ParB-like and HNH nuclease domain